MLSNVKTFTWAYHPTGKRVKKLPPLDKRLANMVSWFEEKFGESPKYVYLNGDMLEGWGQEDWNGHEVLGMQIVVKENVTDHHYALAVSPEDYITSYQLEPK